MKNKLITRLRSRRVRIGLLVVVLLVIGTLVARTLLVNTEDAQAAWYNSSWLYRKKITIDNTKVSGSADHSSFPVLISITDRDLQAKAQTDGEDILFTDSSATKLDHEIESYDSTTGELVAWVEVPTLYYNQDTPLYIYYGNSGASNQENATGTWSNSYDAVWLMAEDPSITTDGDCGGGTAEVCDSTSNNFDPDSNGSMTSTDQVTGQVSGSIDFDGSDDYLSLADNTTLDYESSTEDFTIGAWFKRDTTSIFHTIVSKRDGVDDGYLMHIEAGSNHVSCNIDAVEADANTDILDSDWHYVVCVFDRDGNLEIYLDGQNDTANPPRAISSEVMDTTANINIGHQDTYYFDGGLDQIHISSTTRTSDWIATEYNNQSSPSTFYSLSSEQTEPEPPIAYWKFDEGADGTCPDGSDACDSTENSNHGELGASASDDAAEPTWQTEDLCISDKCLYFDGSDDYVDGGSDPSLDITGNITIEAWIRSVNGTGIVNGEMLVENRSGGASGPSNYAFAIQGSDSGTSGVLQFHFYDSGWQESVGDTQISTNKWHHVAVTFNDDTDTVQFYIDGEEAGTVTETSSLQTDPANLLRIGRSYDTNDPSGWDHFKGFIDEVKIYPYARSADQIRVDYAGGAAVFGDKTDWLSDGLVGYWDFPEATGSATLDKSGNENDLTFNSMQETGIADSPGSSNTTIVDTNGSLSSNDDAYNNMILEITDSGCSVSQGTRRSITDYDGGTNTITVSDMGADADLCEYIIKHQVRGKFGNAIEFEGNSTGDDQLWTDVDGDGIIDNNSEDDPTVLDITGPITLAAWINGDAFGDIQNPIVWKGNGAANNAYYFHVNSGSQVELIINGSTQATSTDTLSTDTWHHVTATYDGSEIKFYIDGSLDSTTPYSSGIPNSNNPLRIGGDSSTGSGRYFNGTIDEVRIYDRALSPAEVQDLYEWAPGPIGYWPLDEGTGTSTVYDRSGNGHSGSMEGSMTQSDWIPGKFGSALNLDGDNDYLSSFSFEELEDQGSFTISAWIKPDFTPTESTDRGVFNEGNNVSIIFTATADDFRFRTLTTNGTTTCYTQGLSWNAGEWHLITGVYDGSNMRIYWDGEENNECSQTGTVDNTPGFSGSFIGFGGGPSYFLGAIDDVRVYNYARTQAQIVEDMNAGHPAPGSPVGSALGHWKFDEGYGDTAYDSGTGGNNANLGGSDSCPGGSACPDWTSAGKFNRALDFNNNTDITEVADSDEFTFSDGINDKPLTLSAWVNTSDGNGGDIISKSDVGAGSEYRFFIQFDSGNPYTQLTLTGGGTIARRSDTAITTGVWNHLVATYDGSGVESGIKLYMNGNEVTTNSQGGGLYTTMSNTSVDLFIGARRNGASVVNPLTSQIDDVRIYNSELTADQVKLLFNQSSSAVWGATSSDTSGTGSYSASAEYCPPGSTDSCTPPVAEWLFDEKTGTSANDTSENANTGTLSSSPEWQHAGECATGSCLDFDGQSGQRITAGSDTSIDNTFDSGGSVSFWYYNRGANNSTLIEKRNATLTDGWLVSSFTSGGNFRLQFEHGFDGTDNGQWRTGLDIPNNVWHHITVVYDNGATGNDPKIYVDGIEDTLSEQVTPNGTRVSDAAETLSIGAADDAGATSSDGILDSIRIYNYERTPAQIAWDYNRGAPIGWWKFDECSGSTAYDSSGNDNNGTITESGSGSNVGVGTCGGSSGTMWADGTTGKRNASLEFDGTDDYVEIADNVIFDFIDLTVSVWYKGNPGNGNIIFAQRDTGDSGDFGFQLWAWFTNGADVASFNVAQDPSTSQGINGNKAIDDNQWHHIVGVFDAENEIQLFVDGKLDESATTTMTEVQNVTIPLSIGTQFASYPTLNEPITGQIDDVRIYNYALTEEQIQTVMNEGAVRFGPSSGSP